MISTKPSTDQLEISIFGPGVGEGVVVHVGDGKWLVVDSCLNSSTRRPAALEYLEDIGVAVERDVAAVVLTHWHDDHTRGASEILRACSQADFFCSGAMNQHEFFQLVASAHQLELKAGGGSGIDEMARVFEVLRERPRSGRTVSPQYATANTVIYRQSHCIVEALSPSSASQTRGFLSFAPDARVPKRAIPNPGPNEMSVAIHIQFGSIAALLGADLEVGSSDAVGWRAVMQCRRNPPGRACIVKVPHHGSAGADHQPIWDTLIDKDSHSGVTPFNTSRLPRPSDIARLRRRTGHLFHTSPKAPRRTRFDRMTERTLEKAKISERSGRMGHIRFRVDSHGTVSHELFGAAVAM
jgi:beta-lactamase superfamily II metal-dependent hydrolase